VAHDAGAARLLFSWLKPLHKQLRFYVAGPAREILEQERPHSANETSLEACLNNCRLLLSGTGWTSDLEHRARSIAAEYNMNSIAVLDHWVNYRERFQRQNITVLPHTLWVSDTEALVLAQKQFPTLMVQQLPNHWLNNLAEKVTISRQNLAPKTPAKPGKNLLYFLEPLRDHETGNPTGKEFEALDYWLAQLPKLMATEELDSERTKLQLRLRPHPSEPRGKYMDWIRRNAQSWPLQLDSHKDLAVSIANADLTFGCETQALVAAMACGVPGFSTLPPSAPRCRLPHRQLQHLALADQI